MQNTYLGQTAGGILKTAKIAQMRAGNWEVVVKSKDGQQHLAVASHDGTMLTLVQVQGCVAQLSMSAMAAAKMAALSDEVEARSFAEQ